MTTEFQNVMQLQNAIDVENAREVENYCETSRQRKHTCFEKQLHGSKVVDCRRDV